MAAAQPRQGELFSPAAAGAGPTGGIEPSLALQQHQLLAWQERLRALQAPLFGAASGQAGPAGQGELFGSSDGAAGPNHGTAASTALALNPLALSAQSLQFWRWPQSQQRGAALYFVLDRPPHLDGPLLLYVGETGQADRRWKGEHDCKSYLAAYGEALQQVGLGCQLSIRFWLDAPQGVKARRALEQALIRHWLPPFNKETRGRWATPFTAELD